MAPHPVAPDPAASPAPATSPDPAIALDDIPPAFRTFAGPILAGPAAEAGLIRLLGMLGQRAPKDEARDFALLIRRSLSQSTERDRVTEAFLREAYPEWYIRAVNDPHRNRAYRHALEALVTPETTVLEAGTGSGLFAMMAARAGARHVYTCEKDVHVARIARENIARNGLSEKITLIETSHERLRLGEHLPEQADLLIHEFVGAHFAVKNITSIARNIRRELLRPGAVIVPDRFEAVGMLIGDTWPLDHIRVGSEVEGLDVSAINLLALAGVSLPGPVVLQNPLGPAFTLTGFSIDEEIDDSRQVTVRAPAVRAGTATGVLQWVRHRFPDGSVYENRPDLACNWAPCFWPFSAPVAVTAGAGPELELRRTETEVFINLVTNSGG